MLWPPGRTPGGRSRICAVLDVSVPVRAEHIFASPGVRWHRPKCFGKSARGIPCGIGDRRVSSNSRPYRVGFLERSTAQMPCTRIDSSMEIFEGVARHGSDRHNDGIAAGGSDRLTARIWVVRRSCKHANAAPGDPKVAGLEPKSLTSFPVDNPLSFSSLTSDTRSLTGQ